MNKREKYAALKQKWENGTITDDEHRTMLDMLEAEMKRCDDALERLKNVKSCKVGDTIPVNSDLVTCPCGAVFTEAVITLIRDFGQRSLPWVEVECPACKRAVVLQGG